MRLLYVIAGAAVIGLGAGGYFLYFKPPPTVKVATAALAPVSEFVYATGAVEPTQMAKVVPLQRRRVVELCRCEGQSVIRGQILGRQDDSEERSVLKEMEIRHRQLLRDRDRAVRDYDRGNIKKAELERIETSVQESSTQINAQTTRLETLVFRAPMDGLVLRRDGEVGEIAGPTDVLFWVGKPAPLQVVADISEQDITKVAVGQTAYLSSEAFEREQLRASVSHITPKGDAAKKTFRVYLLLPPKSPLRIGMTVETNIVIRQKTAAVVVPVDAVAANAVQIVTDSVVRRVPVTTGIRGTQLVEMISGVSAGASVVSPIRKDIADGTRVQIAGPAKKLPVESTTSAGSSEPSSSTGTPADAQGAGDEASADLTIAGAVSAHIQSIVSDARRNAGKMPDVQRPETSAR